MYPPSDRVSLRTRDASYSFDLSYGIADQGPVIDGIPRNRAYAPALKPGWVRRKTFDPRYNCFGHVLASGLGSVGALDLSVNVKILLEPVTEMDFDIRRVLAGNGLSPLTKDHAASHRLLDMRLLPGDIVLYMRALGDQPEHAGLVVYTPQIGLANAPRAIRILSKLGDSSEDIHDIADQHILDFFGEFVELWGDR